MSDDTEVLSYEKNTFALVASITKEERGIVTLCHGSLSLFEMQLTRQSTFPISLLADTPDYNVVEPLTTNAPSGITEETVRAHFNCGAAHVLWDGGKPTLLAWLENNGVFLADLTKILDGVDPKEYESIIHKVHPYNLTIHVGDATVSEAKFEPTTLNAAPTIVVALHKVRPEPAEVTASPQPDATTLTADLARALVVIKGLLGVIESFTSEPGTVPQHVREYVLASDFAANMRNKYPTK